MLVSLGAADANKERTSHVLVSILLMLTRKGLLTSICLWKAYASLSRNTFCHKTSASCLFLVLNQFLGTCSYKIVLIRKECNFVFQQAIFCEIILVIADSFLMSRQYFRLIEGSLYPHVVSFCARLDTTPEISFDRLFTYPLL